MRKVFTEPKWYCEHKTIISYYSKVSKNFLMFVPFLYFKNMWYKYKIILKT